MVHDLHPAMAGAAPGGAAVRPFAGALSGLGRQQIAAVLGMAAVFALSSNSDLLGAWRGGEMRPWLGHLAGNFLSTVMIAAVMWLPIVVVGNLGPQAGWKRYAALALAIVLTVPLAAAFRFAYIELVFPEPIPLAFFKCVHQNAAAPLLTTQPGVTPPIVDRPFTDDEVPALLAYLRKL